MGKIPLVSKESPEYRPYWVLRNNMHKYCRVHTSECPRCNNGIGPRLGHTGDWHGFWTKQEALDWARNIDWTIYPSLCCID